MRVSESQWAAVVGTAALVLRLAYLQEISSSPFFAAPAVDGKTYADQALALAGGAWAGEAGPFWQPPLYPYLLGLCFRLGGEDYWLPRLAQALLGAGACVLLYLLGRAVFPRPVAIGAGLAAAAYGPLIYFGGELVPVTLAVFLDLLLLVLSGRKAGAAPQWQLVCGAVLGLSALAVPNALLLLPALAGWLWLAGPRGRDWVRPALLVAGCAAVIAPVTVRNRVVGSEWVLISHNGGVNFYIGNNPDYDRTVQIRPGYDWAVLVEEPALEEGLRSPSARSAYFYSKSWDFISSDPLAFAGLTARKLYLFWHGDEILRNLDPYFGRNFSALLRLLMWKHGVAFPFGLVAPLALFGLAAFWRSAPARGFPGRLLIGFLLLYTISVVAFFVTSRYRLPAVPVALLFAAHGVDRLLGAAVRRRLATLGPWLLAIAALGLATNVRAGEMNMAGDGHTHFALAYSYERQGMTANAIREYRAALRLLPDHLDSSLRLAALLSATREHGEAIAVYRGLLQRHPSAWRARFLLGNALLEAGRYEEAMAQYESLAVERPGWADLQGRLGYAYLMSHQPLRAVQAYREVLQLRPDSTLVRYQLARLYEDQDSLEAAAVQYGILAEADPADPELRTRLANALIAQEGPRGRRIQAAEEHLRQAIQIAPRDSQARWSLGLLLARQARYLEATAIFEELLELEPADELVYFCLANLHNRSGRRQRAEEFMDRYSTAVREKRIRRRAESDLRKVLESLGQGDATTVR